MKSLGARFISCFLFLCLSFPVHASPQTHKYQLDNGLTVLITEKPSSPTTAIYAWVKTGSANEDQYLGSGITHFVEHMLFKGTDRRGVSDIPNEVKEIGGKINAATSYDYTVFTLTVPNESLARGVDIIADMMMNATIDPEEVEKEREVIVNEMRMINDRPSRQLGNLVFDTVFERHPYQHPIIGYPKLFAQITPQDLMDYYKTWYVPNNIIVAVAGGSSRSDIEPLIQEHFASFEPANFPIRHLPPEGEQIFARYAEKEYPTEVTRVTLAYPSVSILHQDVYALDVLAMAFGQGASSRLYKEILINKELVSDIDASNLTPYDKGLFDVTMTLKPDVTVDQAVKAVKEQIDLIKRKGLSAEELDKIKRQVLADHIYGSETASGLAYRTAIEEAFLGDPAFSQKYIDHINEVTNEDVMRVAQRYLTDQKQNVVVLKPVQHKESLDVATLTDDVAVQKHVLPNGVRLLIKEDDTIDTVNVAVTMQAGTRYDSDRLLGVGQLTGQLWRYGTKRYPFEKLNDEVESLGGGISTKMTGDALSMYMRFLAQDRDKVLTYLSEMLLAPTFPAKELEHLKKQAKQSLKIQKDSIGHQTFQRTKEILFQDHPYARDSLGTEESIDRITRDDVVATFDRFLSSDNLTIAVYGNIDGEEFKNEISRIVSRLPSKQLVLPTFELPRVADRHEDIIRMDKEQAMVVAAFQGPNLYQDDVYPLSIIMSIMGSSLDGRLFKNIREKYGKAYSTHAGFNAATDLGVVFFYALTSPEDAEEVKGLLKKEIQKMIKGFTKEEVQHAKTSLKSQHAMSLETLWAQANSAAEHEMLGLGYDYAEQYDDRIDAVTTEDLSRVVETYFKDNQALVVSTLPLKNN